jgi:hypothetical protein
MATQKELQDICYVMYEMLGDNDLTNSEALEIAVNLYGTVCSQAGVTVHDAVGAVMDHYKKQHANS